ncbi:hypothetical protein R5R35_013347 [Gryllus longicercus]|uniref:Uncharacterized protein n=1 Tax=Gryllus longicercus TaxID=2509291 RepID=A0AAN9VTA3_9ORTH
MDRSAELAENVIKIEEVKQEPSFYEKDQMGHFTTSSLSSLQTELVCADDQQQQQQERVKIPLQISQRNPKKRKENSSVQGSIVKKPTTRGTLQAFEESMQEVKESFTTTRGTLQAFEESMQEWKESYEKLMQSFKKGKELFARHNELCHVKQEPSFYEKDQMGHFTTSSLSSLQTVKQESNDYEKDQVGHFTTSSLSSLQSEGDKPRSLKREVKQENKEELVCADDQQQQQQERVKIPLQISQRNPKKRKENSSVQGAIVKKPTTQGTLQAFEESMQEVRESYQKLMQCFKEGEEFFARQNELCQVRPRTCCQYCQNMGELNYVPDPNYMEIVIRF